MKTLFSHVNILIKDKKYRILSDAYFGIENDKIIYVGKSKPKDKYDNEEELGHHLIMPGLINAHGHAGMTLLRGVGSGLKLHDWLNKAIFPLEAKLRPIDVARASSLAALEMLRSGTTSFADMYDYPYASLKVYAQAGMRANICRVGLCFNDNFDPKNDVRYNEVKDTVNFNDNPYKINNEIINEIGNIDEYTSSVVKDKRVIFDLCLHSEYLTKPAYVDEVAKLYDKHNVVMQIHASETKFEVKECQSRHGMTPIKYLDEHGVVKANTCLAHCVYITNEELNIVRDRNATIVYNPSSNMKLGSGFAPIAKVVKMGINVALGTDGCASNDNLDLFKEMRIASLLQTGKNNNPRCLKVDDIIDMATINGAKALNRSDIGQLKVGYKADFIVLDTLKPHYAPFNNLISNIVFSAHSDDVIMTYVDGKCLYREGKYLTLDENQIYNDIKDSFNYLYK